MGGVGTIGFCAPPQPTDPTKPISHTVVGIRTRDRKLSHHDSTTQPRECHASEHHTGCAYGKLAMIPSAGNGISSTLDRSRTGALASARVDPATTMKPTCSPGRGT